ncbi:MAG: prepilin-type N-terminal cleavage/methylation domain-containing protein [Verrucomicrobia bacterium]|nr:prepilin-type N-terminal cleavage/methylation domain-containing protein [Verrucomicrobiota bacterium]
MKTSLRQSSGFLTPISKLAGFVDDSPSQKGQHRQQGFTLVELLVVIGIMLILLSASIPAVQNLGASRGISSAASQISSALELAKSTAVSRNTYVWVGLATVTNEEGNLETCVGIMMSRDGTSSSTTTNLTAVTKLTSIEHVALANASDLPASLRAKLPSDVATETVSNKYALNLNNSLASFEFKKPNMPGGKISFGSTTYNDIILISPQGEIIASASSQNFVPQIMIGLTQSRKGTSLKDQAKDGAVLVFYGGTGQVRVYRL